MTERRKMKKPENVWFLLGALAVLAMGIPYLILGKDAIFVYHDQLDGEVIAYLLQARHLWDGSGILPEFMNGAARTALTMPAPACVLLIPSAACGDGACLHAGGRELCRICRNVPLALVGSGRF